MAKAPVTYTHVGGRAAVGYQHSGRDFGHYEKKAGRQHALNCDGSRRYQALCGVTVWEESDDVHDQGGSNPIQIASKGTVTCKKCLAGHPEIAPPTSRVVFRLMYEVDSQVRCWAEARRRSEIEQWESFLYREQGAASVWIEEVTRVTTY